MTNEADCLLLQENDLVPDLAGFGVSSRTRTSKAGELFSQHIAKSILDQETRSCIALRYSAPMSG